MSFSPGPLGCYGHPGRANAIAGALLNAQGTESGRIRLPNEKCSRPAIWRLIVVLEFPSERAEICEGCYAEQMEHCPGAVESVAPLGR